MISQLKRFTSSKCSNYRSTFNLEIVLEEINKAVQSQKVRDKRLNRSQHDIIITTDMISSPTYLPGCNSQAQVDNTNSATKHFVKIQNFQTRSIFLFEPGRIYRKVFSSKGICKQCVDNVGEWKAFGTDRKLIQDHECTWFTISNGLTGLERLGQNYKGHCSRLFWNVFDKHEGSVSAARY